MEPALIAALLAGACIALAVIALVLGLAWYQNLKLLERVADESTVITADLPRGGRQHTPGIVAIPESLWLDIFLVAKGYSPRRSR